MAKMGRPRQFDRDAALDAALRLFWAQGFEPTSLSQLKETMGGLSNASFYGSFGSKEALFREVVTRYIATHGQATASLKDDAMPPRQAVEAALRNSARMQTALSHPPGCLIAIGASNCSLDHAAIDRFLADERRRNREGFERHVARAVESGELPPQTDVPALARLFNGFLLGMTLEVRDGVPFEELDSAITALMMLWDRPATGNGH